MKRILFAMLAVLMFGNIAEGAMVADTVYEYRIDNATGEAITTVIPTTSIRPDVDKIVGYDCCPYYMDPTVANTETFMSVFDGTDKQLSGECFGENEKSTGNSINELFYTPRKIGSGVVVRQGSNTISRVYFIRT